MIAYIDGKLTHKDPTYVIIETNGVGYQIKISLSTYSALPAGERCKLHTILNIKEDAHTLYGFATIAEKDAFLHLISISGVGPNTGLMILSSLSVEEIQQAIVREDVRTIQNVKGIGAKTAQRIILELKDKIKKEVLLSDVSAPAASHNTNRAEALSALVTLGFARNVAEKTLDAIIKRESGSLSVEELIKFALKSS
ncbi:Holliday junction branch migration protein RuvA [Pontibacter akesuensis]|uniref:Holliday junction branch migration complex subunit RuvA n=1 Tax=Pontibacter akesuensis TaxID=388950 RepID=A0A1I7KA16_9BACT|nr:Holliday junction branch migration protein RuvA [Pontibacter akesuensis]GHA73820.1 Holliday junction ATP-dependent DNA helicase RuvA [Pontibacter akesuensis]SFU94257.1 Holliday junction DNA helicase subunit RuvA [Pontibacter akesuensis]